MKKKFLAALLAGLMLMATGCSDSGTTTTSTTTTTTESTQSTEVTEEVAEPKQIVFILQGGSLGDQAANDAAYAGIAQYCEEFGAEYSAFEVAELQDMENVLRNYCDSGYDLICLNSATPSEFVDLVAPDYPDVRFVVQEGDAAEAPNVLNVKTTIQEAGFICGVYAALMNEELTGQRAGAFVAGQSNPELDRSQYAFSAGVNYMGGESTAVYVGSFTDSAKSKELTLQLFSQGIHVVQAWAGGANTGVFEAAENMGEGYQAMGGATGQFHMSESIVASQVKNNDTIAYQYCYMALNDGWESGTISLTLEDGAVGIKYAPDGRDADVPQEIKDIVEEVSQMIISGEIVPPTTEDEYNAFNMTYGG